MRKLLLLFLVSFCAISCEKTNPQPIEKYSGKNYIITHSYKNGFGNYKLQIKNKDTIFYIEVLEIDIKNLAIGDTIK